MIVPTLRRDLSNDGKLCYLQSSPLLSHIGSYLFFVAKVSSLGSLAVVAEETKDSAAEGLEETKCNKISVI